MSSEGARVLHLLGWIVLVIAIASLFTVAVASVTETSKPSTSSEPAVDEIGDDEPGEVIWMDVKNRQFVGENVTIHLRFSVRGQNETVVNRSVWLFDHRYEVTRDIEKVSLEVPPDGTSNATLELNSPSHGGNYSIFVQEDWNGDALSAQISVVDLNNSTWTHSPNSSYPIAQNGSNESILEEGSR